MPSWGDIVREQPEFAGRVRAHFESGRHKTIATLRYDGAPRISGIECEFTEEELRFGSMPGSRKGADLIRDPRFALHGPTFSPAQGQESEWPGEAKISGRAVVVSPGPGAAEVDGDFFAADIEEVVVTGLNTDATKLAIERWTPDRGLEYLERD